MYKYEEKRVHTSFLITPTSSYIVIIALSLAQPDDIKIIIVCKHHRGHELNSAKHYIITRRRENIFVVFENLIKRKTRKSSCSFRVFKKQRKKKREIRTQKQKGRNNREEQREARKQANRKDAERRKPNKEKQEMFLVFSE